MTKVALLVPILALQAACGGFDCEEKCNEPKFRSDLVRALRILGEDVDEDTVCDRKAIRDAEDCAECTAALMTEYGVVPANSEEFCD